MQFYNAAINTGASEALLRANFQMPMPTPEKIQNLVFSGGGTKGVAYVGVLKVLDSMNITKNVRRYAGASAGAITAALLAIGMTTAEIEKNLPTSFMQFLDPEKGSADAIIKELEKIGKAIEGSIDVWDIMSLWLNKGIIWNPEKEHMGLFKGDAFLSWLKQCFVSKGLDGDITFSRLQKDTGKELHLMLCNSNYGKTLVANYINTPDMPVSLAVRCSMAIPFFFYPITYNGDLYVDGGTMYNYPVEIFDDVCEPEATLGFILATAPSILWPERSTDNSFFQHVGRVLSSIMNVSYEYCFREGNASRTVFIDPAGVSSINFNLTQQQIHDLKQNGESSVRSFFISKYGPDQNMLIQREYAYPIVAPPGKTINAEFELSEHEKLTSDVMVVINGDLYQGSTDLLTKTNTEGSWSWTNTGKTNAIIFITGWIKNTSWQQISGVINKHNIISFDKISFQYNIA